MACSAPHSESPWLLCARSWKPRTPCLSHLREVFQVMIRMQNLLPLHIPCAVPFVGVPCCPALSSPPLAFPLHEPPDPCTHLPTRAGSRRKFDPVPGFLLPPHKKDPGSCPCYEP